MKYRRKPIIVDAVQVEGGFWMITQPDGEKYLLTRYEFKTNFEQLIDSPCTKCAFDPMLNIKECTDCKKYDNISWR